jgi:hypothetical protein
MVRVVYIAGENRSGTTLLSRVIGAHVRCVAVGELFDFWGQWREGMGLCGCGVPCRECAFWTAVLTDAFGSKEIDPNDVIALIGSVQRAWHLPYLLFPRLRPPDFQRRLHEYVAITERLYQAIQRVSGCDVIVDSSKFGVYALALAESPKLDVRVVHMIRDSRACAFSWRRLKRNPTVGDRTVYLPRRSLWRTAVIWNARNLLLAAVSHRFTRSTVVRYEELVCRPSAVVRDVIEHLDLGIADTSLIDLDGALSLPPNHIFAGNPDRMNGVIHIRPDNEWRTRMPRWQQRFVYALTLPTRWVLGYLESHAARVDAAGPDQIVGEKAG